MVSPFNKKGKKSGEAMLSDEFFLRFRELFVESCGYVSPNDWNDMLDLGKTFNGMISASEADEIIRKLSFKSFETDYKTMLAWLPEVMNEEAADKTLKILEELWERTLFILASKRPDQLLLTILSRKKEIADPVQVGDTERLACGSLSELQHLAACENSCSLLLHAFELQRQAFQTCGMGRGSLHASSSTLFCSMLHDCCARVSCCIPAFPRLDTFGPRSFLSARSSHHS